MTHDLSSSHVRHLLAAANSPAGLSSCKCHVPNVEGAFHNSQSTALAQEHAVEASLSSTLHLSASTLSMPTQPPAWPSSTLESTSFDRFSHASVASAPKAIVCKPPTMGQVRENWAVGSAVRIRLVSDAAKHMPPHTNTAFICVQAKCYGISLTQRAHTVSFVLAASKPCCQPTKTQKGHLWPVQSVQPQLRPPGQPPA